MQSSGSRREPSSQSIPSRSSISPSRRPPRPSSAASKYGPGGNPSSVSPIRAETIVSWTGGGLMLLEGLIVMPQRRGLAHLVAPPNSNRSPSLRCHAFCSTGMRQPPRARVTTRADELHPGAPIATGIMIQAATVGVRPLCNSSSVDATMVRK